MPEMIIPGTYIEVRAEGLIRPGPISINNLGIIGTARRGELNRVYTPANIGEAREIFGPADPFETPIEGAGNELTLIRALELAYGSGASRVFAVRVAGTIAAPEFATYSLTTSGTDDLVFEAIGPGTGYNNDPDGTVVLETVAAGTGLLDVSLTVGNLVETWREVPDVVPQFARVINGNDPSYNYRVRSSTGGGSALFRIPTPSDTSTDTVDAMTATQSATPEANGGNAGATEYGNGLTVLENEDVHIVVLAGAGGDAMRAALVAHVETASDDQHRRERIGVLGSTGGADLSAFDQEDGRLVFVAPGVRVVDTAGASNREVPLPGTYAAAAVAGRIASLDPQQSPTNQKLNVIGVDDPFNASELEQRLLGRTMPLETRNGATRIVRGLTTNAGAFSQVTTRRIVDFAKFSVRAAANPFIGKLNNERVRQALKGSVNSALADMVDREMLVSYELEVSATRDQQIRGIAQVDLVLRPTFSIDFIRVIMYLE